MPASAKRCISIWTGPVATSWFELGQRVAVLRVRLLRQNEVPVAQQIELASMPVEDSYDGPRMEGAHRTCGALFTSAWMLRIPSCILIAASQRPMQRILEVQQYLRDNFG